MTHKKVNNADAGTVSKFGGNDLDKWSDYASGVDTDDYDINSDTQYRYDKFQVRNSANSFGHKHRSAATAARTFTYPDRDLDFSNHRNDIYKIGATYYAEKFDGTLISSSGTFETVLQAALNLGGTTNIEQTGTFTFNSIGVQIPVYTHLHLGQSTVLSPPASSAGFVMINIGDHPTGFVRNAKVTGGRLLKATGEQDWTAIELSSPGDSDGNAWAVIEDVVMYYPGTGIVFNSYNDGWISNAHISRCTIYYSKIGVDFQKNGSRDSPFRSVFDDLTMQPLDIASGKYILYGFKNVQWKDLTFRDCKVWDLEDSNLQKTMSIAPSALSIRIKAGIIANTTGIGGFFEDNSTLRSVTIEGDEWQAPMYGYETMTASIFPTNGRRKGGWEPTAATAGGGWGMTAGGWTNHAVGGAGGGVTVTYADGSAYRTYTTGAVSGNGAGVRYPHPVTCRGWNPVYKIRFRLSSASARRVAFGWIGSTSMDISGDDNLVSLNGVMLGARAADTTWRILHNNGAGGQGATDTGVAIDTAITTFELYAKETQTNKWRYSINGVWGTVTSTDIPAQDTTLSPYAEIATGTAGTKAVDIFGIYLETK